MTRERGLKKNPAYLATTMLYPIYSNNLHLFVLKVFTSDGDRHLNTLSGRARACPKREFVATSLPLARPATNILPPHLLSHPFTTNTFAPCATNISQQSRNLVCHQQTDITNSSTRGTVRYAQTELRETFKGLRLRFSALQARQTTLWSRIYHITPT